MRSPRMPFSGVLEEGETAFILGDDIGQRDALRVAHRAIWELERRNPIQRYLASLRALRALRDWHRQRGRDDLAQEVDFTVQDLETRAARVAAQRMN